MPFHFHLAPPVATRWNWLNWTAPARRAATLAFLILMNWLLLAPATSFQDVPRFSSHQDKIAHFAIFGTLATLALWSVPCAWGKGWRRVFFILALVAYGAAIEVIQPLIPNAGRSFESMDILWDCIGITAGLWCFERWVRGGST
jgi:VanZ family protein